jgi:N-formylglutamate amidohydrolase
MSAESFRLVLPLRRTTSVVFASPHSGRAYPADFLRRTWLDAQSVRSSEDAFVDDLLSPAPALGAPLLLAEVPRAFVDVNRSADELDPALIDGVPRASLNPRVSSGLGVIPRVVANGRPIYRGKIPLAEAEARIARYWQPYHAALARLLEEQRAAFGEAVLIDMHSMPREAVEGHAMTGGARPEVVVGDRFGAAAAARVVDRVEAAFAAAGLRVARNTPFAGAFVAQQYGRPSLNQHVVQVEIDRSLYMDERSIRPNADYPAVKRLMAGVLAEIAALGRPEMPLAAE